MSNIISHEIKISCFSQPRALTDFWCRFDTVFFYHIAATYMSMVFVFFKFSDIVHLLSLPCFVRLLESLFFLDPEIGAYITSLKIQGWAVFHHNLQNLFITLSSGYFFGQREQKSHHGKTLSIFWLFFFDNGVWPTRTGKPFSPPREPAPNGRF